MAAYWYVIPGEAHEIKSLPSLGSKLIGDLWLKESQSEFHLHRKAGYMINL